MKKQLIKTNRLVYRKVGPFHAARQRASELELMSARARALFLDIDRNIARIKAIATDP